MSVSVDFLGRDGTFKNGVARILHCDNIGLIRISKVVTQTMGSFYIFTGCVEVHDQVFAIDHAAQEETGDVVADLLLLMD